jgi:hypothetical protein
MIKPNVPKAMVIGDIYNHPWQDVAAQTLNEEGWEATAFSDPHKAYHNFFSSYDALVVTSLLKAAQESTRTRVSHLIAQSQKMNIPVALILDESDLKSENISRIDLKGTDIYIPKAPFDKIGPFLGHWLNPVMHGEEIEEIQRPGLEVVISPVVLHDNQIASRYEVA